MSPKPSIEPSENHHRKHSSDDGRHKTRTPERDAGNAARAATRVAHELRIPDKRIRRMIGEALAMITADTKMTFSAAAERLIEEGRNFRASPRFTYGGWTRFFGEGLWTIGKSQPERPREVPGYIPRRSPGPKAFGVTP
jgi:hypothetical protein